MNYLSKRVNVILFSIVCSVGLVAGEISQDCENDYLCYRRVEGAQCADGSPTGYSVVYRKNATKLLVFLDGGGACWNYGTCKLGAAGHLSEYDTQEGKFKDLDPKLTSGWANLDNPKSPIAEGFNIVRVHYCTADVFLGDRVANYSLGSKRMVVRHNGYRNLGLILNEIVKRFPNPEKLVFYGASAGGIGVTWNLKQLKAVYPATPTYVVNDGGLIFKAPFVGGATLDSVLKRWGADKNYPVKSKPDFVSPSEVLVYNAMTFPDVRYGLISSYHDSVMSSFSGLLMSPDAKNAVPKTLKSLVENELKNSRNQKVFLLQGTHHVFFKKDPSQTLSDGKRLSDWANAMFNDQSDWDNVNPGDILEGSDSSKGDLNEMAEF